MATKRRNRPSEFEGNGVNKIGIFGLSRAWEKLRYAYRTGEDPVEGASMNVEPDDFGTGGLREPTDKIL